MLSSYHSHLSSAGQVFQVVVNARNVVGVFGATRREQRLSDADDRIEEAPRRERVDSSSYLPSRRSFAALLARESEFGLRLNEYHSGNARIVLEI